MGHDCTRKVQSLCNRGLGGRCKPPNGSRAEPWKPTPVQWLKPLKWLKFHLKWGCVSTYFPWKMHKIVLFSFKLLWCFFFFLLGCPLFPQTTYLPYWKYIKSLKAQSFIYLFFEAPNRWGRGWKLTSKMNNRGVRIKMIRGKIFEKLFRGRGTSISHPRVF